MVVFYFGSGWVPIGTGTWIMLRIISTNLSQKILKDALDLEGFCKAFNYEVRYLREFVYCVHDVELISVHNNISVPKLR